MAADSTADEQQRIPDAAVEAARSALLPYVDDDHFNLSDVARQALEAAAPLLQAPAWDKGYTAGRSNAMRRMSDEPNAPTSPNPYLQE